MKLRLLNGAHSSLAAIGRLAGLETVADTIEHPTLRRFIGDYWAAVIPTLAIPAAEARAYTCRALSSASPIARCATRRRRSPATPRKRYRSASSRHCATSGQGAPCRTARLRPRRMDPLLRVDDRGKALALNDPTFESLAGPPRPAQRARPTRLSTPSSASARCSATILPRRNVFAAALERDVAAIAAQGSLPALEARLAQGWA